MALLNFGSKLFKWVSHDNESFRKTPRPVDHFLTTNCFLFLKTIISVFPVLRERERVCYYQSIDRELCSHCLRVCWFFKEIFQLIKRLVSSAKWCMELFMIALCKSLIKSMNNKGPSTNPCSTPCIDISLSELYSLSCILIFFF